MRILKLILTLLFSAITFLIMLTFSHVAIIAVTFPLDNVDRPILKEEVETDVALADSIGFIIENIKDSVGEPARYVRNIPWLSKQGWFNNSMIYVDHGVHFVVENFKSIFLTSIHINEVGVYQVDYEDPYMEKTLNGDIEFNPVIFFEKQIKLDGDKKIVDIVSHVYKSDGGKYILMDKLEDGTYEENRMVTPITYGAPDGKLIGVAKEDGDLNPAIIKTTGKEINVDTGKQAEYFHSKFTYSQIYNQHLKNKKYSKVEFDKYYNKFYNEDGKIKNATILLYMEMLFSLLATVYLVYQLPINIKRGADGAEIEGGSFPRVGRRKKKRHKKE